MAWWQDAEQDSGSAVLSGWAIVVIIETSGKTETDSGHFPAFS